MLQSRVVLITGCSSGIGAALAHEFHRRGHRVYATARRLESIQALADRGLRVLSLDVTDAASVAAAVEVVRVEQGQIDLLVNNAGYGLFGAAVDLDTGALRRQFETNVIGLMAVTRAFVPMMCARRQGCIVNLGSASGVLTTPFAGAYCASKAAVHALSDALRMELAPFGVHVVTVQAGGIASRFGESADIVVPEGSPFASVAAMVTARARASQRGATPTPQFAAAVADAVLRSKPDAVLRLGRYSLRMALMRRWIPVKRLDRILARRFGLDRLVVE
jgi:short-subunit dehydrogenase